MRMADVETGRKRLLWIGDAGCPSGFARATHETLKSLDYRQGGEFECTVLGINYRGDPHQYPYPIYAAAVGGDWQGVDRLIWMCDLVKPDVIVIQQDPWNLQRYINQLRLKKADGSYAWPEHAQIPVVASIAVDGKNVRKAWFGGLSHAIFWTEFAKTEAALAGYEGSATVIPLGVDQSIYYPIDRYEARSFHLPKELDDAFIVGSVNRNQPRKRWDLLIKYFATWVKSRKVKDAYLFLHAAPTGDVGVHAPGLAKYYGVLDNLLLSEPQPWYGLAETQMRDIYNCLDVYATTTQGEGFGLTALEAMACGVPIIVPDWAALGEICKDGGWMVPCTSTAVGPPYVNVIGGIADEKLFVDALHSLYTQKEWREQNRQAGLEVASKPRYRWENIGKAFNGVLLDVLAPVVQQEEVLA